MKKTRKIFDAVAESRRWRAETSKVLDAMSCVERIAYLATLCPDTANPKSALTLRAIPPTPFAVHEAAPPYGGQPDKEAAP